MSNKNSSSNLNPNLNSSSSSSSSSSSNSDSDNWVEIQTAKQDESLKTESSLEESEESMDSQE